MQDTSEFIVAPARAVSHASGPAVAPQEPVHWTDQALPWLFSAIGHMAVLVVLASTLHWTGSIGRRIVPTTGVELEAVLVDRSGGLAEDAPVAGIDVTSRHGTQSRYYEDSTPTAARTDPGRSSEIAELLSERPAVDLRGVLPAANQAPGGTPPKPAGAGTGDKKSGSRDAQNALRGNYTRTGVFGAVAEGQKFVYVFDRSGSMEGHGGAPLRAAKAELINSLHDLTKVHQFQIIFYNETPRVFNPTGTPGRLVFGTDQNKQLAERFIGSIVGDGGTRHEEALRMALRMAPDVIFFLTDADEPRLSARQLADLARLNQGTVIDTIEFGYGVQIGPDNFLDRLAKQSGGRHVYVDISQLNPR